MALQDTDDCEELEILRHFRDLHIQNTPEGEAIVAEYYRVGLIIVNCIENLPDPSAHYLLLWEKYIAPSCQLIKAKQWESYYSFNTICYLSEGNARTFINLVRAV